MTHKLLPTSEILTAHNKGQSVSSIARTYNCSITGVSNLLKRNGCIIYKPDDLIKRDWSFINDKSDLFFYWLGWMLSDGHVFNTFRQNRNRGVKSRITVHKNDIHILEFFRDIIQPNFKIKFVKRSECATLDLSIPRIIYNIVKQYGLIPNKTYRFKATKLLYGISQDQFLQFLVGFIEGDGCIDTPILKSKNYQYKTFRIRIVGNNYLLKWIQNMLYKHGFWKRKLSPHKNIDGKTHSKQFSELGIAGKDAIKLGKMLLKCQYHKLGRKWVKLSEF